MAPLRNNHVFGSAGGDPVQILISLFRPTPAGSAQRDRRQIRRGALSPEVYGAFVFEQRERHVAPLYRLIIGRLEVGHLLAVLLSRRRTRLSGLS
jgi:hypothetical protein